MHRSHSAISASRSTSSSRIALKAGRCAPKGKRQKSPERRPKAKAEVRAVKRAVPLAPYRGGPLQLRPYQIDGVAWLAYNYLQKRSTILADEMGLGKTVQTISFLGTLKNECGLRGPSLVVAPLSVLTTRLNEFQRVATAALHASKAAHGGVEFIAAAGTKAANLAALKANEDAAAKARELLHVAKKKTLYMEVGSYNLWSNIGPARSI